MTFQNFTGLDIIIDGKDFDHSLGHNSNVAKDDKEITGDKKKSILSVRTLL